MTTTLETPSRPKYESYSDYKDSGVEWLGEIPNHWESKRLKFVSRSYGGGTPSKAKEEFWSGDIPWVSPKDMKQEVVMDAEDHVTPEAVLESSTRMIEPGAVLIVVRSGILRHKIPVAINLVPVALNQDMKAFVTTNVITSIFLKYLILGQQRILLLEWRKSGATVESLENELIANTEIPLPTLPEQTAIADFLDRETAKIDALIEKKRRLIDLLEEKRTALISYAVTKGLDPNAPMKDSGVEWLGEIPAHWEVKRLKTVSPQITVGIVVTPAKYYVDSGVPCIRSLNVKEGRLLENDLVFISEESNFELRKSIIMSGDLVAVRTGQPGTTSVVDDRFDGANCIDLIVIRQSRWFDSFYLSHLMNSDFAKQQYGAGSGGAIQQHFNIETAKNLLIPLPPNSEQISIRQWLDQQTGKINRLKERNLEAINTLLEYRTALISAAVTGKIDVREEVGRE